MGNVLGAWQTWALLSAVFAAATAILQKVGVAGVPADVATVARTTVVLVLATLIATARGAWALPRETGRGALIALALSGVATGLSWLCYARALQLGPASRVAPIDKLSVVLVVIAATAFLGEPMGWRVGVGAGLIAAGAMVIAWA